jgi:hypothetical protein
VDIIVGEVAAEFGGADHVEPDVREKRDEALQENHDQLLYLKLDAELREPLPEELDELRELLQRVQEKRFD